MASQRPDLFSDLESVTDRDRRPVHTSVQRLMARCYPVLVPCVLFALDWAGINWHRSSHSTLINAPHKLVDIWWHLPVYLIVSVVFFRLGLHRRTKPPRDNRDDNDDRDKPITLGL